LTAVYALALVVPAWSAALIVGIAAAITAAVTIRFGWKRVAAVDLKPRETIESVKENVVWLKNRLS
jgi:hypothetical protein